DGRPASALRGRDVRPGPVDPCPGGSGQRPEPAGRGGAGDDAGGADDRGCGLARRLVGPVRGDALRPWAALLAPPGGAASGGGGAGAPGLVPDPLRASVEAADRGG